MKNQSKTPKIQILSHLLRVIIYGAILATLFTAWTPLGLLPVSMIDWWTEIRAEMRASSNQDPPVNANGQDQNNDETVKTFAIVAGHWGNDSGATCADGLTEVELNLEIASYVQKYLSEEGIQADLLLEKQDVLQNYAADGLISIHADTCEYINPEATGFKVAPILGAQNITGSNRLTACIIDRYASRTNLPYHNSVTKDMQEHQAFSLLDPDTPAVIIETGFMNLDRQILTEHPDLIARGIVDGILCYLNDESILSGP